MTAMSPSPHRSSRCRPLEENIAELESLPDQTEKVKNDIEAKRMTIDRVVEDYADKMKELEGLKKLYGKD